MRLTDTSACNNRRTFDLATGSFDGGINNFQLFLVSPKFLELFRLRRPGSNDLDTTQIVQYSLASEHKFLQTRSLGGHDCFTHGFLVTFVSSHNEVPGIRFVYLPLEFRPFPLGSLPQNVGITKAKFSYPRTAGNHFHGPVNIQTAVREDVKGNIEGHGNSQRSDS
jgi:hypothetical protein